MIPVDRRPTISRPKKCTECDKYNDCTELCEDALAYVDQDQVPACADRMFFEEWWYGLFSRKSHLTGVPREAKAKKSHDNFYSKNETVDQLLHNFGTAEPNIVVLSESELDLLRDLGASDEVVEAVDLMFVQGRTMMEAARELGVYPNAVRHRVTHAGNMVRESIERRHFWSRIREEHFYRMDAREICRLFFGENWNKFDIANHLKAGIRRVRVTIKDCANKYNYPGDLSIQLDKSHIR